MICIISDWSCGTKFADVLLRGMLCIAAASCFGPRCVAAAEAGDSQRRPVGADERALEFWLENMVRWHGFSPAEVESVLGIDADEQQAAIVRLGISREPAPRAPGMPLRVLPYPGGRHPRVGFLEGAVDPQRDTKASVFTPWDPRSYVVVDLPEAVWSQHGLLYLAHTHVPTMWTRQGIELEQVEWKLCDEGSLTSERRLPNGVRFAAEITPEPTLVRMTLTLTNGSAEPLTDLRVQNCVMLKGAVGFAEQTNANKEFRPPYAACRDAGGRRWIVVGFSPLHRAWGNERCPCLHADPVFPDCAPGETQRVRGVLSFYEGTDLAGELQRLDDTGWRNGDAED